jgi:hypothetical protein
VTELNELELAVLASLDGGPDVWPDGRPIRWGAALGSITEFLRGSGYLTQADEITPKGRDVLTAHYAKA